LQLQQKTKLTSLLVSDFQWVEGDRCEVVIQAINPSPYELRITNMQLLTENVDFESESTSVTLSSSSEDTTNPTAITLSGTNRLSYQRLNPSIKTFLKG